MDIKVSVVTCVYNGEDYIKETIDSILDQTFQDFEYIIVDDGSTDSTIKIIESYNDERIKLIQNKKNLGPFGAANKGLEVAKGKYVARIDADDIAVKSRLETQFDFLEKNPKYKLVGGFVTDIDASGKKLQDQKLPTAFKGIFGNLLFGNVIYHSTIFFNRKFIDSIGNYDDSFRTSADYDLYLRIIAAGGKLKNLEEILLLYRIHDKSITKTKLDLQEKNAVKMLKSALGKIFSLEFEKDVIVAVRKLYREREKLNDNDERLLTEYLLKISEKINTKDSIYYNSYGDFLYIFKKLVLKVSNGLENLQQILENLIKLHETKIKLSVIDRRLEESNHVVSELKKEQERLHDIEQEMIRIQNSTIWQIRNAFREPELSMKERVKLILKPFFYKLPYSNKIRSLIKNLFEEKVIYYVENDKYEGPLVSVVIVCYNYGHYIDECIQSCLNQELDDKLEIIVVDGYSNDGTREFLKRNSWPNTKVIFQDHRASIGENRLTGFSEAKGKYICAVDADDKLGDGFIKKMLEPLETEHYDVAYPSVEYFEDDNKFYHAVKFEIGSLFRQNFISCSGMFRRSFWEKNDIGYSHKKDIFEDWEFWLRMAKAGARFKEVLPARLMYRIHSSSKVSITDDRLKKQQELTINTLKNYENYLDKEWFKKAKEKQKWKIEVKNPRANLDWEKNPFISIITPVFNGEDFIEDVIKNLEKQTYRNFEHIVIDGGSTDGTIEILKKYRDRLIYISEPDEGQSDAINKGFKLASGEVLTWLNADDYYASEDVLEKVFKEFQDEDVNLISATAQVKYLDKEANDFVVPQLKLDEKNFIRWWHYFSIPPQPSIFFRKKVIEDIGLIDTNLHYTMDHDLWLRMVKAGYEFKQIPEVWSVCQIHNQSKTGTSTRKFQLEHEKVAKRYWGSKLSLTYWRRLLQYVYAKYFKYQDHFAK